jgi:hypothetical protein
MDLKIMKEKRKQGKIWSKVKKVLKEEGKLVIRK